MNLLFELFFFIYTYIESYQFLRLHILEPEEWWLNRMKLSPFQTAMMQCQKKQTNWINRTILRLVMQFESQTLSVTFTFFLEGSLPSQKSHSVKLDQIKKGLLYTMHTCLQPLLCLSCSIALKLVQCYTVNYPPSEKWSLLNKQKDFKCTLKIEAQICHKNPLFYFQVPQ